MAYTLLIKNCGQILTMKGVAPKRGRAMLDLGIIKDGFVACEDGKIFAVGRMKDFKKVGISSKAKIIDAKGCVVMPGLIDCHTHLVFAGSRAGEFAEKLSGKSYLEILAGGGGILSTVKATRAASRKELLSAALNRLKEFLSFGVTTVEAKSGYGLDLKNEVKILDVLAEVSKKQPVRIVKTFLGAHVIAPEFGGDSKKYLKFLMGEVLPKVKGKAEFVDIFCEEGAFSLKQSEKYLRYAKSLGFKLKIHAEQINRLGGSLMACKLGAFSADHCDKVSFADMKKMAKFSTVAVFLPVASFYLSGGFADGRKMIDCGVPVAVSTDFNPGSAPCKNIFFAMLIACLKMGLRVEEVLTAVTINAACALGLGKEIGSIEKGKCADLVVTNVKDYREIPYWCSENVVENVVVGGKVVA